MSAENPELFVDKMVKARKLHICCECDATIAPGETYQRVNGVWAKAFCTFATCKECSIQRASLLSDYDAENVIFGQLDRAQSDYGVEEYPAT